MTTIRAVATASLSVFALVGTACMGHNEPNTAANPVPGTASTTGVTNAQKAADMRVIDRLTNARCDHAQSCDEVGEGKKYASRDLCVEGNRASTANDLNAVECPRGIEQGAVDRCIDAMKKQPCGVSLANISAVYECRTQALCMK